jgi:hypothetical protein
MLIEIGFDEFQDKIQQINPGKFSLHGMGVVWDYLTWHEKNQGEPYLLNPAHVCKNFYETEWQTIAKNLDIDYLDKFETDSQKRQEVKEWLIENNMFCGEVEDDLIYVAI